MLAVSLAEGECFVGRGGLTLRRTSIPRGVTPLATFFRLTPRDATPGERR